MPDAKEIIQVYRQAAELNRNDPVRAGNLLRFPHYGQLVMTGDMHGHMRNFEKLSRFCDLGRAVVRHVILHELIHGDPDPATGLDLSAELLTAAARYKIEHPDQVHFLQSNHELAQLAGQEITKGGRSVSGEFIRGVAHLYGERDCDEVMAAVCDFLASYPLAGITTNGVFLSHSLPNARDLSRFRPDIVNRKFTRDELMNDGSVHMLVWGREHRPDLLDQLSHIYQVELFIVGHQPQATGYNVIDDRLLILASDHNHGVFTTIDLSKPVTMSMLVDRIRPFVAVP